MFPKHHIILGLIISIGIFIVYPSIGVIGAIIIFLSSFLIDFDHYAYFVFKNKNLSLFKALKWFGEIDKKSKLIKKDARKNYYSGLYFLHGIEALIILFLLSYFSPYFLLIIAGFLIHQLLDLIEIIQLGESFDKLISFFYAVYRARNKKHFLAVKS